MKENVIFINQEEIKSAKQFADEVLLGQVTHGVICYRKNNGDVCYRLFNPEHITYISGLMELTKLHILTERSLDESK
jgi:hypothetical protein